MNSLIINNLYASNDDIISFDLTKTEDHEKVNKLLLGDEDAINNFLLTEQFHFWNWAKIRSDYSVIQNNFLSTFLSQSEILKFQETQNYKLAIAMGYIDIAGPSIKIGSGELAYNHQLLDFKLPISYSMNGVRDLDYDSLLDLSMKLFETYKMLFAPFQNEGMLPFENEISFYYFDLLFENKDSTIWNSSGEYKSLNNFELNTLLKDFSETYHTRKLSFLNKVKLSERVLKEKNIYFSIENIDNNIANNVKLTPNKNSSSFFHVIKEDSYKLFQNFDYMMLNLFGIIKIKIKFDREQEFKLWENYVIF
ncbi:hypothetical protein [Spiroplasma floricola]|uniref:Uncharacterized protein n=1 Tax=Spiroplasma floricola 23-6 TaxID=1336749 RepID=A0A2K8SEG6_9MOLU|nr:hypothetical protein [Spiroplasma floricola]AUB31803.1 hypothetical protein SFLOR_v1c07550 [Spiroplasma floricola 23-6]